MEHERGAFKVNIQMWRSGEPEFSPACASINQAFGQRKGCHKFKHHSASAH